ncbi:SRPBCC family protein [Pseudonocardia nantongensis]|uniref:SRPBCC family protein n=1 Tax=Pseudonocardia nantongensis TaxID=1181885 RepID=UPI00397BC206
MKISGTDVVPHPVESVWDALLDPRVLVTTIPGCEKLEATGDNEYAMTVTAGVAAVKGSYSGSCALSDLKQHESLVMTVQGAGGPGTITAVVDVGFDDLGAEGTRISYAADATVGGVIGGVGQRMLASVSKRLAAEFFGNVGAVIAAPTAVPVEGSGSVTTGAPVPAGRDADTAPTALVGGPRYTAPTTRPGVHTGPAAGAAGPDDLTKGIGIGAAVALLGVLVGAAIGRRR